MANNPTTVVVNDVTVIVNGVPMELQSSAVLDSDNDDLGAGIQSSFPVISFRANRWRFRYRGIEELMLDERGSPVQQIGVCLLKVPDHKSKRLYIDGFDEKAANRAPDCWSIDAIKPDASLTPPNQPDGRARPTLCANCFFNEIGSMVSNDGKKKMKWCGDYKRVAVKLYYPTLAEELTDVPMLLTIPAGSLQNLKTYGEFLKAHKQQPMARVTWIKLNLDSSFPLQEFSHGPPLSDDELMIVRTIRNGEDVANILRQPETIDSSAPIMEEGRPVDEQVKEQATIVQSRPVQPTAPEAAARPVQPTPTRSPVPTPATRITPAPSAPSLVQRPLPAGRPVLGGTINQAINRPAAAPPSARVLQHPAVHSQPVDQGEPITAKPTSDDSIQTALEDKFAELMKGKIK